MAEPTLIEQAEAELQEARQRAQEALTRLSEAVGERNRIKVALESEKLEVEVALDLTEQLPKAERRVALLQRAHKEAEQAIGPARMRKADVESQVNRVKRELAELEREAAGQGQTARKLASVKRERDEYLKGVSTTIARLESELNILKGQIPAKRAELARLVPAEKHA